MGTAIPPQPELQALYWLTVKGYTDACAQAHWSHQYLCFKTARLEAALLTAQALSTSTTTKIDSRLCSSDADNDGIYNSDPRQMAANAPALQRVRRWG